MEILNNVRTIYRADTGPAVQAVRTLKGEEQAYARSVLEGINAQNAKLEAKLTALRKVSVAIGSLSAAWVIATKAASNYLEDVRLESAAAGANVDRLAEATSGLIEQDKLLDFAGKAMHGTWRLSQDEMERVLRGAMALRAQFGTELTPTIEKLTEAVSKGSTRSLREFGLEAKDKEELLRKLDDAFRQVGGSASLAGDEITRSEVSMKNSLDELSGALGELVVALGPVISALAKVVGLLKDSVEGWKMLFRGGDEYVLGDMGFNARNDAQIDAILARNAQQQKEADEKIRAILNKRATAAFDKLAADAIKANEKRLRERGRKGTDTAGDPLDIQLWQLGFMGQNLGQLGSAYADSFAKVGRYAYKGFSEAGERSAFNANDGGEVGQSLIGGYTLEQWHEFEGVQENLSKVFGVTPEVDAHAEAINAAAQAYGILATAAGEAYEAMVTGSKSATEAIRAAVAGGLLALGKEFFVRALGETAMGIASLAIGGPIAGTSAAGHFKAAAAFGVAAGAAGVAARALGAGRSAGGASAGGAGDYLPNRSRTERSEQSGPINIYVGSEWEGLSAIQRASAINRALRLGRQGTTHVRRG